jgi:hypothetical protein
VAVATGGDRVVSLVTGARKVLTSGTRLLERADARLMGGAGLAAGEGAWRQRGRAGWGTGRVGRTAGRGARERVGPKMAQPRGEDFSFFFFFYFYFLFLFLFLLSPFLLNK